MAKGTLFVFSAPSGAGKSSLARALIDSEPSLATSVSHTTRAPRPGEEDGKHYHFVDQETFRKMVANDEFLEHATVFDNSYGTSQQAVQSLLDQDKSVILDIDWQGARAIKQKMDKVKTVFILPPSREELEKRLQQRNQDSDETIARRMRDAISEMRHYDEFDYVVVNDDFDLALADLRAILSGHPEKCRPVNVDIEALLKD
jgi:guanylate kinase